MTGLSVLLLDDERSHVVPGLVVVFGVGPVTVRELQAQSGIVRRGRRHRCSFGRSAEEQVGHGCLTFFDFQQRQYTALEPMSSMSKLWTTLGLSLLMQVFTRPFVQQRLLRYWLTRNPPTAEMTATGTATARCSVEREESWRLTQACAQTGDTKGQRDLLCPI